MISDGQWDSVFGLGFGRLQGSFSADVVDTFQSIGRVWIVAFGKKIAHFVGFGREIGVVTAKSTKPEKLRVRNLIEMHNIVNQFELQSLKDFYWQTFICQCLYFKLIFKTQQYFTSKIHHCTLRHVICLVNFILF